MTAITRTRPSSRDSSAGAGWADCSGPGDWISEVPEGSTPSSWLNPKTLWAARNDVVAKYLYDPVDRARMAWVRAARERALASGGDPDFVIRRGDGPFSFLLLGDPGEGDNSQYAVVPPLLAESEGTDFTVICSDVIYPSGELGDYEKKFFHPYRDLECPIYAVPGNHDWYDGLDGFMSHLCGIDVPEAPLEVGPGLRAWLARKLWRRTMRPDDNVIATMREHRSRTAQRCDPAQPGPYWAIDAGPIRIVGIDTGVVGSIDREQAQWLERVSLGSDRPKILLTGKPLIVNGARRDDELVARLVADPRANYVLAIGGDTHNYQRYPVTVGGRTIHYVVSGGGGAYTHATHQIGRVDVEGVTEDEFKCYPLRSDSLARFSQLYDERLAGGRGWLRLSSAEAAAHLSTLLKLQPTRRQPPITLSRRARIAAKVLHPAPSARGFHRFASEYFDWNDPPFFKHFLRIDVLQDSLTVRCYGVTGCRNAGQTPPVEDEFTVRF